MGKIALQILIVLDNRSFMLRSVAFAVKELWLAAILYDL